MAIPQLDIENLSTTERIELAEKLWESVASHPRDLALTASQEKELDRRLTAYRQDPTPGEPWRESLEKIGKSVG